MGRRAGAKNRITVTVTTSHTLGSTKLPRMSRRSMAAFRIKAGIKISGLYFQF